MKVWVKIGDFAACPVGLPDDVQQILLIFDLQEAIKTQRSAKFHDTDADEIFVRPPISTESTERLGPS